MCIRDSHSDVGAESEREHDRGPSSVSVRGVSTDHSGQITMVCRNEVGRVTNCTSKLNRFERGVVIERNKFCDDVRPDGFHPEVERQITGVEGATSVHEAAERRVMFCVRAKVESDVREAIVDSNRHWWKR